MNRSEFDLHGERSTQCKVQGPGVEASIALPGSGQVEPGAQVVGRVCRRGLGVVDPEPLSVEWAAESDF